MTKKKIDSLVMQLENAVLALEGAGQNEQDIFSLVNMIMRGFIRNGEITEEYRALAHQVRQHQERTVLMDANGRPMGM